MLWLCRAMWSLRKGQIEMAGETFLVQPNGEASQPGRSSVPRALKHWDTGDGRRWWQHQARLCLEGSDHDSDFCWKLHWVKTRFCWCAHAAGVPAVWGKGMVRPGFARTALGQEPSAWIHMHAAEGAYRMEALGTGMERVGVMLLDPQERSLALWEAGHQAAGSIRPCPSREF